MIYPTRKSNKASGKLEVLKPVMHIDEDMMFWILIKIRLHYTAEQDSCHRGHS